ncbi:MAG TPA: PAS domain S-box protein [Cyclobacteriaceae bacterium]|nr:PAS domain S-box protein [Cyclobacteriaceae bacterium]
MNKSNIDIRLASVSTIDIKHRIGSIFADSAVLDVQFNFVSISPNISEAIGYTSDELLGKHISIFLTTYRLIDTLEECLQYGSFEEKRFELLCKGGETIRFSLSAIYLGHRADINGLIVLRFKNQDEVNRISEKLIAKTEELDDFIYNSAHSLRGPLATLKGLINLAGIIKNPEERDFLFQQMNVFSERLDETLHQLIFFAESDKMPEYVSENLSIGNIFQSLAKDILEASIDFPVHFSCPVLNQEETLENGGVVLSMLKNMALFFCQQPKTEKNSLVLDAHFGSSATEIMIRSKGFAFNDMLIEKLRNVNFGYSEILKFPELVNYYAAKKIMYKLNGTVQFMHLASCEIVVLMTIPRDTRLVLF